MHNVQTRALPDANDYQVQGPDQEDNQPKNSRPTGLDTESMPACTGQFMAWHKKTAPPVQFGRQIADVSEKLQKDTGEHWHAISDINQ